MRCKRSDLRTIQTGVSQNAVNRVNVGVNACRMQSTPCQSDKDRPEAIPSGRRLGRCAAIAGTDVDQAPADGTSLPRPMGAALDASNRGGGSTSTIGFVP